MKFKILLVKESRAGETRVGLTPPDVKELVSLGHIVFVEHNAGEWIDAYDQDYVNSGGVIRVLENKSLDSYKKLFDGINFVVRVKRANKEREILETQAMNKKTVMLGALDPLEKDSSHIREYHNNCIIGYSIDQLDLGKDDPMNILTTMSKIAGKLAVLDAINKFHKQKPKKAVIIGYGVAGKAAFEEATKQGLSVMVVLRNIRNISAIEKIGGNVFILCSGEAIEEQQDKIKNILLDADIVIASARKSNETAPVFITQNTMGCMKRGAVIVDLALSEGGNIEGSKHDETLVFGNDVIVTNSSGYPKACPKEASAVWSRANLEFIKKLENGNISLQPC
jgi:NAD/NADP transhydrogenase alpha subunit